MRKGKYRYERLGSHVFRIYYTEEYADCFGKTIRYEIQEPAPEPRNWWERLKQFFTVASYDYGYWTPSIADDTLEERVASKMSTIVHRWDAEKKANDTWANL